jgi:signal peptidase II
MNTPAKYSTRLAIAVSLLVCFVGCDQTTKYVATKTLCGNPPISCLSNTFRLEYAMNPGGFLSLGENLAPKIRFWIFTGLNMAFLAGIVGTLVVKRHMRLICFVALLLALAGGIGNLIDRMLHGGLVIDFLNLGIGPVRTGIFNVADMALMAGAIALLLTCRGKQIATTNTIARG